MRDTGLTKLNEDIVVPRGRLEELFNQTGNSTVFNVRDEEWTLKKILRRFIWHDRIHGKSIYRILRKQGNLGLIGQIEDPFRFDA